MVVWSWMCPKPGLKVARKTISKKVCLAKIPMEVICWKEKELKKCIQNVTKCIHCQKKYTQYVYKPIYICTIKRKISFTVFSFTNLIIEEVISVIVPSAKLRTWHGVGFTSTRASWAQIFPLVIFQLFACFWSFW